MLLCGCFAAAKSQKSHKTHKTAHARHSAAGHAKKSRRGAPSSRQARSRGQRGIDNDRVREIQTALINAKYLDGEPSGTWDDQTKTAMVRYQSDNGWQTKTVPDSRALIKLGLGPNHDHILNPETAVTTHPALLTDQGRETQPGGATLPQQ